MVSWARPKQPHSSPTPPMSSADLIMKFIEECKRNLPPPRSLSSSQSVSTGTSGRPSLDTEVLLARAEKLARADLVKIEHPQVEPLHFFGDSDASLNPYYISPTYQNGYGVGLRISPRRSKYIFERGMKAGDVLIGVNGHPTLTNTDLKVWLAKKVVLEVLRGEALVIVVLEGGESAPYDRR